MALGEYLSSLDLNPGVQQRLLSQYGPAPAPVASDVSPQPVAPPAAAPRAEPLDSMDDPRDYAPPGGSYPAAAPAPGPVWRPAGVPAPAEVPEEAPDGRGPGGPMGGGPPPAHYVPGGWQNTNRGMTTQHGIDPSAFAEGNRLRTLGKGYGEWAAQDEEKAAAGRAKIDEAYATSAREAQEAAAQQREKIQNEREAYVAQAHAKLNQLNTAAQAQVDPEAAKGSMGSQMLAAIGIALGQFGASLNGGQNTALQIVNANIDRRIAAQQANINNAHKALDNEQNLYKTNLEAFGDRDRATAATKMQMLDQAKAIAEEQYAKGPKTNENAAAYHKTMEGLQNLYAGPADAFGKATADQVTTSGQQHYQPGGMVGGGGPTKDLANVVSVNGTDYQLPNEKEHAKAVSKIQIVGELQSMNNAALASRKKLENLNAVTDRTEYLVELGTLKDLEEKKAALMSSDAGQGVLRDSEYARTVARQGFFTEGVGGWNEIDPTAGPTRRAADTNIRRQIARGDSDMKRFVEAAGGRIVKRGYATDTSGNLAPVAAYTGQDTKLAEALPPKGFVPMKAGEHPTAATPAGETTDYAPRYGAQPPASHSATKAPAPKRRK